MSDEGRAALIRGLFVGGLLAVAVAAGLWFGRPGRESGGGRETPAGEVTPETVAAVRNQPSCVVVLQAHKPGNAESERLQEILSELKEERYGDEVRMAQFDVERCPEIGRQEGVTPETAPQLSFHIEGQRVGDYRGPWQKAPVQRRIDEILHGYMQRINKRWRPPVPGMVPDRGQQILEIRPAES